MNALKPRPSFQILIMSEESRLGRESIETGYALKQLITAGVRVFFYLDDRERTLDSPMEKIIMQLANFGAELEREKGRQRTTDAMCRLAKAGRVCGGRLFGFNNVDITDKNGKRSHVERTINEPEAAVIRRIFEMAALGYGAKAIAKRLNAEGIQSPRAQRGRSQSWAPSSVHTVLRRETYRGVVIWNRTKKRDKWGQKKQRVRPESEWVTIPAPTLQNRLRRALGRGARPDSAGEGDLHAVDRRRGLRPTGPCEPLEVPADAPRGLRRMRRAAARHLAEHRRGPAALPVRVLSPPRAGHLREQGRRPDARRGSRRGRGGAR
jgi:DNA invertase Pin-like site-specific DNA recombinase